MVLEMPDTEGFVEGYLEKIVKYCAMWPGFILSRSYLEEFGGWYSDINANDWEYYIRLASFKKIYYFPQLTAFRTINPHAHSASYTTMHHIRDMKKIWDRALTTYAKRVTM